MGQSVKSRLFWTVFSFVLVSSLATTLSPTTFLNLAKSYCLHVAGGIWSEESGTCFERFLDVGKPWSEAYAYCRDNAPLGTVGELGLVRSEAEYSAVEYSAVGFWVRARRSGMCNALFPISDYYEVDIDENRRAPITWQPSTAYRCENLGECLKMSHGGHYFEGKNCTKNNKFICEYSFVNNGSAECGRFKRIESKTGTAPPLSTITTDDFRKCGAECLNNPECVALEFEPPTTCKLAGADADLSAPIGVVYHRVP